MSEYLDIRPDHKTSYWWLVEHGTYPATSVLAGQYRRRLVKPYGTLDEAVADNPGVEVNKDSTAQQHHLLRSTVSVVPPTWFDPTTAGERWDEDY